MTTHLTSYRPSVHGFRFGNRFRRQGIGPIATCGWSSGMAQVSLDFFHAGRAAPAIEIVDYGVRPASGIAAASWSADRVDLFIRCDNDVVATQRFEGGRFSDWRDLAFGESSGSPAAVSRQPGQMDIVVRGADGRLWHQRHDKDWASVGAACLPPPAQREDLGGDFASSAAVAASSSGMEAYARDADGCLWFAYDDGTWHGWESLRRPDGITLEGDPAAAAHAGWRTVVVVGSDNAVWQREWAGGGWLPWRSLGGTPVGAPALASPHPGRLEAYIGSADGNMHLNVFALGQWQGWIPLGAPPPGLSDARPAAVSHTGLMDVYALAKDQAVWHKRWWNGWQPWQSTESAIGLTSRTLTDAIYHRLMTRTVTPVRAALAARPPALAGAGTAGKFVGLHAYSDDWLFDVASIDEMAGLAAILRMGNPVSVGLLGAAELGHEMVVYGGDINPGGRSELRVYDPNYPGCDRITILIDPALRSIGSSSGERWRSLWVRDDIKPEPPAV